jgi:hypothetical protein
MHQPEGNHANHMSAQDCSFEQDLEETNYPNETRDYQCIDDHDASDEAIDNLYNDQSENSVECDEHTPIKHKAMEPKYVTEVHHSTRIATRKAGYKTKEAKKKAEVSNSDDTNISMQQDPKNKKAKGRNKKLPSSSSSTH